MKFYYLADRNFKEVYRDPVSILLGMVMPIAMLLIFTGIEKKLPLELFSPQMLAPGIAIFSFTFIIMFSAVLLAKDKQSAFLVRLFTTPMKASDYILSYMLPFIPLVIIQGTACFVTGMILGASFSNVFPIMIVLLTTASICISIGMILGSLCSLNQISGIGSILITGIGFFSNIWMDLRMIGGIFEKIGYMLPFAHAVDAVKALASGNNFSTIAGHFFVVLIYAIVFTLLAVLSFRQVMKKE